LVAGTLTGSVTTATVLFWTAGFYPGRWTSNAGTFDMVRFGANLTAFNFINYFQRNFDNVLIGTFWGAADLGLYSRAYALMMVPTTSIRSPVDSVALPALSRLQYDPTHYRLLFRQIVAVVAALSMPIGALLAAFPDEITSLSLGPQWHNAAPILRWLGLVAFLQPTFMTWGVVALSLKLGRVYFIYGCVFSLACIIGFTAGLAYGPSGVAAGYAAAHYVCFFPILVGVYRHTPVRMMDTLREIVAPVVSSLVAIFGAIYVRAAIIEPPADVVYFGLIVACFGLLYLNSLLLIARAIGSELPIPGFPKRALPH
jgi:PST family polysaccharide transporter